MILTFLAQLPLMPVRKPTDLVGYNQVVLMLALAIYLTFGYFLYAGKIPEMVTRYFPANQWLIGLIVLDLILYVIIHRFQFGLFPVLSLQQLPNGGTPYLLTSQSKKGGGKKNGDKGKNRSRKDHRNQENVGGGVTSEVNETADQDQNSDQDESESRSSTEMDLTAEEVDELSSILKQRGGGREQLSQDGRGSGSQLMSPSIPPNWNPAELKAALNGYQSSLPGINTGHFESRSDLSDHPLKSKNYDSSSQYLDPAERSMTDGDYFQKSNSSQAVVENWDEEEFSNMEYLSR